MSLPTSYELIIENGTVLVSQVGVFGLEPSAHKIDVGISQGKITALGNLKSFHAEKRINAEHLHVLPGVIDSQVHFRDPGLTHKEDLESGTRSAILGGITSVFEMPNTKPSTTTQEAFLEKINLTKNRTWCNIGFYMGAAGDNIEQLPTLEKLTGCCGVKIFMGSSTGDLLVEDDDTLLRVLKAGKRIVAIHAEDEARLKQRKYVAEQHKSPRYHPVWRDEESALKATQRAIRLARQARRKVHILHVTTAQEMEFLAANKDIASVEVTPQHLTLFAPDCYDRLGTYAQMNPPIREKGHRESLWLALEKGIVDVIGSDHAPHTHEEKKREYPNSPSGMPGVQTLLPIMLTHVANNKLSLEHLVRLVCENPARIWGLPNKGRIRLGCDADLTLVDLKKSCTIENKRMASKVGWTPFDGMKARGWPIMTIVKGQVVMQDDQPIGSPIGEVLDFAYPNET